MSEFGHPENSVKSIHIAGTNGKGSITEMIANVLIKAGKAMDIRFDTIDIIQTTDGNIYVLEVNSGIGATIFSESIDGGTEIIKDIYREAVEILFR